MKMRHVEKRVMTKVVVVIIVIVIILVLFILIVRLVIVHERIIRGMSLLEAFSALGSNVPFPSAMVVV